MSLSNKLSIAVAAISTACALAAGAARAEVHETAEFADGSTRPISVVVLPSQVELTKQRLIRQEAQVEESGVLEPYLTEAVAREFKARNYDVRVVDAAAIARDPSLQEIVIDANRRFTEMLTNVQARLRKSKFVEERRYNAGDTAKLIAARLGVDAVVFTRMNIIAPAAGVRALNFGIGGETAMMTVTIVDGTSADIEAYITTPGLRRGSAFGGHDEILADPTGEMGKYAEVTLNQLQAADPSLRVQRSDDAVLDDLEALLE